MHVNHNPAVPKHNLPGLEHQTLAGRQDGLNSFEVWRQTISPNAVTPVHRHDCEEVIVILGGSGVCKFEDRELPFKADQTLVIPPNVVHQICNNGSEDLYIIATLAMSPVKVETADGAAMPLPWYA
jgi:mannose-6-phosphate isomerase-like protein (cupin superfamily)